MILRPQETRQGEATPFALEALGRLPLAEGFYLLWAYVAPDDFLQTLFDEHRGRCYDDVLTFPEIILVLADALTRYHGSGNRAITKAIQRQQLSVKARAVYGKLSRLPLGLAEALLSGLTARLRPLFPPGLFRSDIPASLRELNLVVLDGKKIKRVAKRLLAVRGRPGTLFGGKVLVAYSPADGLALAMAADPDGEANDIRLMPRVMVLARAAVAGPRLWIADRQFCDLDQPARFTEGPDHYLVRFSQKCGFEADPSRPRQEGTNEQGQAVVREWGWMGSAKDPRRCYVRRITLVRPGDEDVTLVTDLLDEEAYPAAELLLAYLMRWQIENVFQEITEVFELRHLIGTSPKATVLQASLCLVIYNLLQVIRGYATLAGAVGEKAKAVPEPQAEAARDQRGTSPVEALSSEKIFTDLHEELIGLHRVLQPEELLACLPTAPPTATVRRRLGQLLERAWSADWKKASNKKRRRGKPHAKQSGAHTSVHKALLEARNAKQPATRPVSSP